MTFCGLYRSRAGGDQGVGQAAMLLLHRAVLGQVPRCRFRAGGRLLRRVTHPGRR